MAQKVGYSSRRQQAIAAFMLQTPRQIYQDIVARIQEGAVNRRSAMHTPVVGTADGFMRIMVLRSADDGLRCLRFHTDARCPKVTAIKADPAVNLLFYDPVARIQIRARGRGQIETEGRTADAAWDASTNLAKRCYLAQAAPGSDAKGPASGLPEWAEGIQPSDDQVAPARGNFAVLLVDLHEIDWLFLANTGHRRAKFIGEDGRWVMP